MLLTMDIILLRINIIRFKSLFTFVREKSFGKLISISPQSLIFFKTCNIEFLYIEIWFTIQNSKPHEILDRVILILITKKKKRYSIESRDYIKSYDFFPRKCRNMYIS